MARPCKSKLTKKRLTNGAATLVPLMWITPPPECAAPGKPSTNRDSSLGAIPSGHRTKLSEEPDPLALAGIPVRKSYPAATTG